VSGRDGYTWKMAASDLALTTRLTLSEAGSLTQPLQKTNLHPYDGVPLLQALVEKGASDIGSPLGSMSLGQIVAQFVRAGGA